MPHFTIFCGLTSSSNTSFSRSFYWIFVIDISRARIMHYEWKHITRDVHHNIKLLFMLFSSSKMFHHHKTLKRYWFSKTLMLNPLMFDAAFSWWWLWIVMLYRFIVFSLFLLGRKQFSSWPSRKFKKAFHDPKTSTKFVRFKVLISASWCFITGG